MISKADESLHILLRAGVLIHIQIHGWRNKHGGLHRQIGGDEHVVGNTIGHLAKGRGRTGCNKHGVGPQSQIHMRVPRTIPLGKELANHGLVGQCRQRYRGDKLLPCRGNNHLYLSTSLHQSTDNQTRLIRGYASRNTQYNLLPLKHYL